jgi:hypothetical protein
MLFRAWLAISLLMSAGVVVSQNRPLKYPTDYMSAECLRQAEVTRQAPGNKSAQTSFDERCGTELGLARQKAQEENAKSASAYSQRRAQQLAEVEQTESIKKQQRACLEMKAALANRKARSSATEGDKRDIENFEQRFAQRCPKG